MFKFLYVILRNLFRAPYMIPRMRYEADHPEKFTEEDTANTLFIRTTTESMSNKMQRIGILPPSTPSAKHRKT